MSRLVGMSKSAVAPDRESSMAASRCGCVALDCHCGMLEPAKRRLLLGPPTRLQTLPRTERCATGYPNRCNSEHHPNLQARARLCLSEACTHARAHACRHTHMHAHTHTRAMKAQ
eukprot:10143317-Alexandrium_andersonii.AAC.1